MSQRSLRFIPYDPHASTPRRRVTSSRDDLKEEIRRAFNADLSRQCEDPDLFMRYTIAGYAEHIVFRLGYKFNNWPPSIPFLDVGSIGGAYVLRKLLAAWNNGTLTLEPATEEDRRNAEADPESVHPNPGMLHVAKAYEASKREAVIVSPLVFHLDNDLHLLGVHPTSTRPAAAGLGLESRERRRQRSDTNKARARPVTNPDGRPLRHPKDGMKSSPFTISHTASIDTLQEEDPVSDWATDDPLDEFLAGCSTGESSELDDIESASGFETCGPLSEIEDSNT